jgi:hypothetical protein
MSWWPLHSTWMSASAGWNAGYWTPDNEVWFQKRLDDIRAGIAKPRTTTQWREDLKGFKASLQLKRRNAAAAAEVVKGFVA